ncbi:MAG: hypothetical protein ACNFW9_04450 [Candidatus Kerfeldbacteria bacterium]|jgi:nitrite reductase/ring-hydroxylating ferredoxin subunit
MSYEDIKNNEGKVIKEENLAVCRNNDGKLWKFDSHCTHGDCHVKWIRLGIVRVMALDLLMMVTLKKSQLFGRSNQGISYY